MNYQQAAVSGEAWTRCNKIEIQNPLNGIATARFFEERVISFGNERMSRPSSEVHVTVDQAKVIPIVHPLTGEPTGDTITHAALYVMLYSAYLAHATERDARLAAQAAPAPVPAVDPTPVDPALADPPADPQPV